jgi:hypothetical protein
VKQPAKRPSSTARTDKLSMDLGIEPQPCLLPCPQCGATVLTQTYNMKANTFSPHVPPLSPVLGEPHQCATQQDAEW